MAAREPLKHRRRRARRIACVLGTIVATAASTTAWVILRRPKHTTKSYKAPKPVTYSEFEKQGPWVPLPDARRLLNVKHGAWILDKRDLPQLTKDMSKEAFSDALVAKITEELCKAWPPRVVPGFASALYDTVLNAWQYRPKALLPVQEKKVAFLFLVGSNVATEPIWRSFFASDEAKRRSSIYVHPPRGFAFPAGHFFEDHVIKQEHRYEVKWASLQMVHAELVLLSYALRDPLNERFVLLSETDVPLWPFECTYSVLFASELSFLETKKSDMRFSTLYEFRNTTRPHLQDWRKGSQWFALTRSHAQKLANQNGIRKWYVAFARKQLRRRKLRDQLGDWGRISHTIQKPPFADEHFVQTSLAMANEERSVLPVSLTFARFGIKDHVTVWGDGGERPFRLESSEWHAVQFGALSMETLEKLHELCAFDVGATGPADDDEEVAASRPARIFRGAYRPEKLRCGLVTDKKSERASPCYLFARKLHSEAVDFYSQLSSEFFLAKQNVTLARKLTEARKHQRRDAASETRRALSGTGSVPPGNYARRHMDAVLAALPAEVLGPLRARQRS